MGIYKNVMELLVEEEVERQFRSLPTRVSTYINQVEWVAFALNQLPPLYATSEKGLNHQLQRGRTKHGADIRYAVQRALAAIGRDPLRSSEPLQAPQAPVQKVLTQLRFLLKNNQIEWDTLPIAVEQALAQASQPRPATAGANVPRHGGASSIPGAVPRQGKPAPSRGNRVTPPAAPPQPQSNESFGWDDPLYNPR